MAFIVYTLLRLWLLTHVVIKVNLYKGSSVVNNLQILRTQRNLKKQELCIYGNRTWGFESVPYHMHYLTLWCRDNLDDFSQTTFSNAFFLMKIFLYRFIFSSICPQISNKQYISISKGNSFVPIVCANAGLVYWYMHASFRQNKLRYATQTFVHIGRLHICSRICNKTVVNCSNVFDSGWRTGAHDKNFIASLSINDRSC